jgi:hypothetical protein
MTVVAAAARYGQLDHLLDASVALVEIERDDRRVAIDAKRVRSFEPMEKPSKNWLNSSISPHRGRVPIRARACAR